MVEGRAVVRTKSPNLPPLRNSPPELSYIPLALKYLPGTGDYLSDLRERPEPVTGSHAEIGKFRSNRVAGPAGKVPAVSAVLKPCSL